MTKSKKNEKNESKGTLSVSESVKQEKKDIKALQDIPHNWILKLVPIMEIKLTYFECATCGFETRTIFRSGKCEGRDEGEGKPLMQVERECLNLYSRCCINHIICKNCGHIHLELGDEKTTYHNKINPVCEFKNCSCTEYDAFNIIDKINDIPVLNRVHAWKITISNDDKIVLICKTCQVHGKTDLVHGLCEK